VSLNILVIGATSRICECTLRLFAQQNASFYLLARGETQLDTLKADLLARGARSVHAEPLDVLHSAEHGQKIAAAFSFLSHVNIVFIAHGSLPDQALCERDYVACEKELQINFLSVISLLTHIAPRMEKQESGTIAVITSVAGDRGKQTNFVYGAAKAGLSCYLEGLRVKLCKVGVHVLDIRPGFVKTPMTQHLHQGLLFAEPESVAKDIYGAIVRKKDVLYTPWFWCYIMLIIRSIPTKIFKRLSL
jgi:short-subunit dehydrogenase